MSVEGVMLLFEGFLQKRKDNLKLRWVTYWFRLQNSTLFFYTEKNCSASHLRGYYYIYTVQSVREIKKTDRKRYMFEILMTNGKTKMLAAETAALRKEWVRHLWQAMRLSSTGEWNFSHKQLQVCEQRDRSNSSAPVSPHSDNVAEAPPPRPLSAPPSNHIHRDAAGNIPGPLCPPQEQKCDEATYQNIPAPSNDQSRHGNHLNLAAPSPCGSRVQLQASSSCLVSDQSFKRFDTDGDDGGYDVLPCREAIPELRPPQTLNDSIYDCPRSYRSPAEHPEATDGVYDVPSSLLRTVDGDATEEGVYWRI